MRHAFLIFATALVMSFSARALPVPLVHLAFAESPGEAGEQIYTCSMHPQVRLKAPGKCPICGMPLIPASPEGGGGDGRAATLELSEHARSMAAVETAPVTRRKVAHAVYAVGKVEYNETALATITTRVNGFAERLFVNFTGIDVNEGDHLVEVYSPDLVVAQQELLVALRADRGAGPLVESTKLKLKR